MNKADLIDKIAEKCNLTKADGERVMDTIIHTITDAIKTDEEVSIAGLGKFSSKVRAAREGRNPRTGESVHIPAMRVPKFSASKTLKDAVK